MAELCKLACVSTHLVKVSEDVNLWKSLLAMEFGTGSDAAIGIHKTGRKDLEISSKSLFRNLWLARKVALRQAEEVNMQREAAALAHLQHHGPFIFPQGGFLQPPPSFHFARFPHNPDFHAMENYWWEPNENQRNHFSPHRTMGLRSMGERFGSDGPPLGGLLGLELSASDARAAFGPI